MRPDNSFAIEFDWLPRDSGNDEEKATFAALTVFCAGVVASEVEDRLAKTIRGSFRSSAYHLASWLAENWWRLRWEPERITTDWAMSHHMGAIGGGYLWPNLCFASDGEFISIRGISSSADSNEPVRFLSDFSSHVSVDSFFCAVTQFIEAVLERLNQKDLSRSKLRELWLELRAERFDPGASLWRKREALLGFDPDTCPVPMLENLYTAASKIGSQAIEEVSAACGGDSLEVIETHLPRARSSACMVNVPRVSSLRSEIRRKIRNDLLPWENGEVAADIVRKELSIRAGPVYNSVLTETFSVLPAFLESRPEIAPTPVAAGFRRNGSVEELDVFLHRRHQSGRRFGLMRLIGDHLANVNDDQVLPATASRTARQKFQRAFAQEFLCPFKSLREFIGPGNPTDERIEDAALYFDVSPLLVRSTLLNKGILPRSSSASYEG